jgi:hypothetical protein
MRTPFLRFRWEACDKSRDLLLQPVRQCDRRFLHVRRVRSCIRDLRRHCGDRCDRVLHAVCCWLRLWLAHVHHRHCAVASKHTDGHMPRDNTEVRVSRHSIQLVTPQWATLLRKALTAGRACARARGGLGRGPGGGEGGGVRWGGSRHRARACDLN